MTNVLSYFFKMVVKRCVLGLQIGSKGKSVTFG